MRFPFTAVLIITISILGGCSQAPSFDSNRPDHSSLRDDSWGIYQGAWFTIHYPRTFNVVPSMPSGVEGEYDSVFFSAPDNSVSFYVLSPQWRRTAKDIALQSSSERLKDETEREIDGITCLTRSIYAIDGAYQRRVESYTSLDQTASWTFQFYYKNSIVRKHYEKQYQQFKASLDQYTD